MFPGEFALEEILRALSGAKKAGLEWNKARNGWRTP